MRRSFVAFDDLTPPPARINGRVEFFIRELISSMSFLSGIPLSDGWILWIDFIDGSILDLWILSGRSNTY